MNILVEDLVEDVVQDLSPMRFLEFIEQKEANIKQRYGLPIPAFLKDQSHRMFLENIQAQTRQFLKVHTDPHNQETLP